MHSAVKMLLERLRLLRKLLGKMQQGKATGLDVTDVASLQLAQLVPSMFDCLFPSPAVPSSHANDRLQFRQRSS